MKTSAYVRYAAVAVFASSPLLAHAVEFDDSVQRCMDVFATQNFADRTTSFKVERERGQRTLPLIMVSGTRYVRLVATERASGRLLATASCQVRSNTAVLGEITISNVAQ